MARMHARQPRMARRRWDWAIYIQADEVLHDAGVAPFRQALRAAHDDASVEGKHVAFSAEVRVRASAERAGMFEHVVRQQ